MCCTGPSHAGVAAPDVPHRNHSGRDHGNHCRVLERLDHVSLPSHHVAMAAFPAVVLRGTQCDFTLTRTMQCIDLMMLCFQVHPHPLLPGTPHFTDGDGLLISRIPLPRDPM